MNSEPQASSATETQASPATEKVHRDAVSPRIGMGDKWANAASAVAVAASGVALGAIIAESLPALAIAGIGALASGVLALHREKDDLKA
jgi:hypothetical protein